MVALLSAVKLAFICTDYVPSTYVCLADYVDLPRKSEIGIFISIVIRKMEASEIV